MPTNILFTREYEIVIDGSLWLTQVHWPNDRGGSRLRGSDQCPLVVSGR